MITSRFDRILSVLSILCAVTAASGQDVVFVNAALQTGTNDGSSWANAYQGRLGLKAALDAAQAPAQFWIAEGTYAPSLGDRSASFELHSGIALYGGFVGTETQLSERNPALHETILSGVVASDNPFTPGFGVENAYVVVRAENCDAATILDGLAIREAGSDSAQETPEANLLIAGGSPRIANCAIQDCDSGCDANVDVVGGAPEFVGCRFVDSSFTFAAPMIRNRAASALTLVDCEFVSSPWEFFFGRAVQNGEESEGNPVSRAVLHNCSFTGMAKVVNAGQITIDRCTFQGVSQAVTTTGNATINACIFQNCDGGSYVGGGGILVGPFPPSQTALTVRIMNCLFSGNDHDGGRSTVQSLAVNAGSLTELVNCTFAGNGRTDRPYSAISHCGTGTLRVRNCVLWANQSARDGVEPEVAFCPDESPVITVEHSCLEHWDGSLAGTGNFGLNPQFVDMDGDDNLAGTPDDDLRLAAGSSCIDSGNNTFVPADVLLDLNGASRFRDDPATADSGVGTPPIVDRGAHEFVPPCQGDLEGDRDVDLSDLAALLGHFGMAGGASLADGDIDSDEDVDLSDLAILLSHFGAVCG